MQLLSCSRARALLSLHTMALPKCTPVFVARGDGSETFAWVAGSKDGKYLLWIGALGGKNKGSAPEDLVRAAADDEINVQPAPIYAPGAKVHVQRSDGSKTVCTVKDYDEEAEIYNVTFVEDETIFLTVEKRAHVGMLSPIIKVEAVFGQSFKESPAAQAEPEPEPEPELESPAKEMEDMSIKDKEVEAKARAELERRKNRALSRARSGPMPIPPP